MSDQLTKVGGPALPQLGLIRQRSDGGCTTSGVTVPGGTHLDIKLDRLSWSGRDMERFLDEDLPPTAFEFEAFGIVLLPKTGNPTFEYLQGIQSRGRKINVSLSLDWNEDTNVLSLDDLLISLPGEDFISVEAVVENVDLTDSSSMQFSLGSFGMTSAVVKVQSRRIFQDYLLLPLGLAVLDGHSDPEARIRELKALGEEAVSAAPSAILPDASKAALDAIIVDMPEPAGTLRIEQRANPGIGVARGMTFAMQSGQMDDVNDVWPLFKGIVIDVTYDPF